MRPHCATFVFVGMLNASAIIGAIGEGMCTHEQFIQSIRKSTFAWNSLVDIYSKCGSMENTLREFNKMPLCDLIFWNDILGGCVMPGRGKQSIKHFEQFCDKGVQPIDTTFV